MINNLIKIMFLTYIVVWCQKLVSFLNFYFLPVINHHHLHHHLHHHHSHIIWYNIFRYLEESFIHIHSRSCSIMSFMSSCFIMNHITTFHHLILSFNLFHPLSTSYLILSINLFFLLYFLIKHFSND